MTYGFTHARRPVATPPLEVRRASSSRTDPTVPALRRKRLYRMRAGLIDPHQFLPGGPAGHPSGRAGEPHPPSQIPRSLPTSDIRRSASRSAATAGGTPSVLGEREDLPGRAVDLGGPALGPLEVEPGQLVGDLDHASRVDHVVGGVEDAPVGQQFLDAGVGQLVVGPAADDAGPQGRHGVVVQRAAERARARRRPGRGPAARPGWPPPATPGWAATTRLTAPGSTSQITADAPASARRVTSRRPTLPTPSTPTRRPSRLGLPQRCSAAARMPWKTPNAVSTEESPAPPFGTVRPVTWPRLPGDDVHVLAVGADVARGDVAAAQRLDEAAVRAEQRLGLVRGGIADDHGLAAAVVQAGHRVLVGHRAGQVQHVGQGRVLVRVGVEAGPAERGAERGRVDGDDGPQPARAGPGRRRPARAAGRRWSSRWSEGGTRSSR